jgi:hypothetical protein
MPCVISGVGQHPDPDPPGGSRHPVVAAQPAALPHPGRRVHGRRHRGAAHQPPQGLPLQVPHPSDQHPEKLIGCETTSTPLEHNCVEWFGYRGCGKFQFTATRHLKRTSYHSTHCRVPLSGCVRSRTRSTAGCAQAGHVHVLVHTSGGQGAVAPHQPGRLPVCRQPRRARQQQWWVVAPCRHVDLGVHCMTAHKENTRTGGVLLTARLMPVCR